MRARPRGLRISLLPARAAGDWTAPGPVVRWALAHISPDDAFDRSVARGRRTSIEPENRDGVLLHAVSRLRRVAGSSKGEWPERRQRRRRGGQSFSKSRPLAIMPFTRFRPESISMTN